MTADNRQTSPYTFHSASVRSVSPDMDEGNKPLIDSPLFTSASDNDIEPHDDGFWGLPGKA